VTARGRFITLEGGEGAGKSTQAARLAEWLKGQGIDIVTTREPGGSERAEVLRGFLLEGLVAPFGAEAEAVFFAVARADHMRQTILPALDAGRWVISDRFLDSTWAYQGTEGVPPERLAELDRIAVGGNRPDVTLILDVPAAAGLGRIGGRVGAPDRFERDVEALHDRRRAAYLKIARREPARCVVIDATRGEAEVADAIRAAVAERLQPSAARAG
jgi:dTMP kinase